MVISKFKLKTVEEVGVMMRVISFISALMLGVMVSVCNAGAMDKLTRDRDMLRQRLVEVASEGKSVADMIGKMGANKGWKGKEMLERLMLIAAETILLSDAFGKVDKIVFGIDVLASVVASGGYLDRENYQASAVVFDKAVQEADKSLTALVDCSFCSIRTREVARQALMDLRAWWR
jgi:hypothetical protein